MELEQKIRAYTTDRIGDLIIYLCQCGLQADRNDDVRVTKGL